VIVGISLATGEPDLKKSLAEQAQEIVAEARNVKIGERPNPKVAKELTGPRILLLLVGTLGLLFGIGALVQLWIPMLNPWPIVIGAVITRFALLPFTIRTERYFALLKDLFRTMQIRANQIKFSDDPAKAYADEVYSIDKVLTQNQKNKKPYLFVVPILVQTSIFLIFTLPIIASMVARNDYSSERDPYYVLPLLFLVALIIKHRVFLPYKKKGLLYGLDAFLCFFFLNFPAGFMLLVTSFVILSSVQTFVLDSQSKKVVPIANDRETTSMSEDFDFKGWLLKFKKKGWLFLIDDVLVSLFLSLTMFLPTLIYVGYFYWQQKKLRDKWEYPASV